MLSHSSSELERESVLVREREVCGRRDGGGGERKTYEHHSTQQYPHRRRECNF
jgi:hypothetical protein